VRAGEERWVARRLADLGIPIIRCVRGRGTFEGADAMWLDRHTAIIGKGLRTNSDGAWQVEQTLNEMGVDVIQVDMPYGSMHFMGMLRLADSDLAIAWPNRLAYSAVEVLRERGFKVAFIPDEHEAVYGHAFNIVTLGPRQILMATGNSNTQSFYEDLGISCHTVEVGELTKAAGAMGCLTGIVRREPL
jgi:N-dimethylarginine dimethylaminohydrolase